jgi:hypothetical protein
VEGPPPPFREAWFGKNYNLLKINKLRRLDLLGEESMFRKGGPRSDVSYRLSIAPVASKKALQLPFSGA